MDRCFNIHWWFCKNYDANGDKGYLLEVDVESPIEMHISHEDLPFLSERKVKSAKSHSNWVWWDNQST